jgi:rRNA-processing protein FCF1
MRRVLVDSNALDPLLEFPGAYEALRAGIDDGKLEMLITHVTIDELAAIGDLERRRWLLVLHFDLCRLVATWGACVDYSRLDFCRLADDGDGDIFEALRSEKVAHSPDALIASTARGEGCALVTNEKRRLPNRSRDQGIEVLSTRELLAEFGFVMPAAQGVAST